MTVDRLRWLTVGLLASAGAGLLSLTSVLNVAFASEAVADAGVESGTALIMGFSGEPIPSPGLIEAGNSR